MAEKPVAIDMVLAGGPFSKEEVLTEQFQQFFQSILEQAALTPEQQTSLAENLKASVEKRDKLGSCLAWVDAQAEMLKAEERRLASRRKAFEKFSNVITDSLHAQMKEWGVKRVEGLKFSFVIKKNPPSVEIENDEEIPAEYIDWNPSISKERIRGAMDQGIQVPGAKLIDDKTRLEIK
jgi:hypothetical protein